MKKNEIFKHRLQADIALIEAKLIRFKVRGMGFTAGAKDRHGLLELQAVLEDATQSFKTEPGVADLHGNDDGPFPYGEGLSGRSADEK